MNTTSSKTNEAGISAVDLARLGGGEVAYIREMSSDEATRLFPRVTGIPHGIHLFSLNAADGTPIALTDSLQSALSHAIEGELHVASVH